MPSSRGAWRRWLAAQADRKEGVWVIYRKKSSDLAGPSYDELVEEALCFGWIDSVTRRADQDRMIQWFSPRRPGGLWSALNKKRIERLERGGLMTAAGRRAIARAKADGSWSLSVPATAGPITFLTGPGAAAYKPAGIAVEKVGDGPDGFVKYRLVS